LPPKAPRDYHHKGLMDAVGFQMGSSSKMMKPNHADKEADNLDQILIIATQ
jgi:hypothetical protein